MIDIVKIKQAVKSGDIIFFLDSGSIYCKDTRSEEVVIVSMSQFRGDMIRKDTTGCVAEEIDRMKFQEE